MKNKPTDPSTEERAAANVDSLVDLDFVASRHTGLTLRQILVPIDFSDCPLRALDLASTIAHPFGAKLTLLHVVESAVSQQSYPGSLRRWRKPIKASSKPVANALRLQILVRIGRAHSEIPDTASALGADLIVMGIHGYTGLKHVLLGSTTERVVRKAACPVLTARLPERAVLK